ncbi:MAG TPA: hypothetical protein DCS93_37645 [Microscillaceae bacterium]|nr:hypothetical protein [Microscillaceae bacterium]
MSFTQKYNITQNILLKKALPLPRKLSDYPYLMNKLLAFVLNLNNRLYTHLLFWLAYYILRVSAYLERYPNTPQVQFFELFAKVIAVYINLYILMPYLLKKKKNLLYGLSFLLNLAICGVIQTEVVRQMMRSGIYDQSEYVLYSAHKTSSIVFTIFTVVAYATIIKVLKEAYQNQQVNQQINQERLENELKFLKSQINPHFLFNALNNLYSLILMQSNKAKDVVLKLSDLLSYMLYETNQQLVSLAKDVEYLQGFIELEKLRFGDELTVETHFEGDLTHTYLPPMLLITLVENAFKHSIGDEDTLVHIRISLNCTHQQLVFEVENSLPPAPAHQAEDNLADGSKKRGIGLRNVQRRLELLYPHKHTLEIHPTKNTYLVKMSVDLSH